mgnify:CR=1 FL=1
MTGLFWEEWEVGRTFKSSARTVTEADLVIYSGLSGDYNPLHTDEEFAKATEFGTRIAHGPLVYAIAAGLIFQMHLYDDTLIAFLGFENLKFTKPVKPGDTPRGRHFHQGFEECIYVMSGTGCTEADSGQYPLKTGDTILIPSGEKHATRNTGAEPLVLLCFFPVADISKRTKE